MFGSNGVTSHPEYLLSPGRISRPSLQIEFSSIVLQQLVGLAMSQLVNWSVSKHPLSQFVCDHCLFASQINTRLLSTHFFSPTVVQAPCDSDAGADGVVVHWLGDDIVPLYFVLQQTPDDCDNPSHLQLDAITFCAGSQSNFVVSIRQI